jgi:ribosomal protein S18 acetylase RimI-like enzyme
VVDPTSEPQPIPPSPGIQISLLRRAELAEASDVLARAFADNPVNVAVIGGNTAIRTRSNAYGMRALLPVVLAHGQVYAGRINTEIAGCLLATPPLGHPLPPPGIIARLRCRLGQEKRVGDRWAQTFHILDDLHPRLPHWYLGSLGVSPEAQHQGVGGALLRHFIARADADSMPCYLETDRSENLSFYEGRGFRVEEQIRVLGVDAWRMWRHAS